MKIVLFETAKKFVWRQFLCHQNRPSWWSSSRENGWAQKKLPNCVSECYFLTTRLSTFHVCKHISGSCFTNKANFDEIKFVILQHFMLFRLKQFSWKLVEAVVSYSSTAESPPKFEFSSISPYLWGLSKNGWQHQKELIELHTNGTRTQKFGAYSVTPFQLFLKWLNAIFPPPHLSACCPCVHKLDVETAASLVSSYIPGTHFITTTNLLPVIYERNSRRQLRSYFIKTKLWASGLNTAVAYLW